MFNSAIEIIHHLQLINFTLFKHESTSCILYCESFCFVLYGFQENNVDNFLFRTFLQEKVRIIFFLLQVSSECFYIIFNTVCVKPFFSTLPVKCRGGFQEWFFTLFVVRLQVFLTIPVDNLRSSWLLDINQLIESHMKVVLYCILDQISVNKIIFSSFQDLSENRSLEQYSLGIVNDCLELIQGCLA